MSQKLKRLWIVFLCMAGFATGIAGQIPSSDETRRLIVEARSTDEKVSTAAKDRRTRVSRQSVPILEEILRGIGNTCERSDAGILIQQYDGNRDIVSALADVARTKMATSKEEMMCRREATMLMGLYPSGIKMLTKFLTEKEDVFLQQSAIFTFDEITESEYPEASIEPIRESIPAIAALRTSSDEVLQGMSMEVLGQMGRRDDEIGKATRKYLEKNPLRTNATESHSVNEYSGRWVMEMGGKEGPTEFVVSVKNNELDISANQLGSLQPEKHISAGLQNSYRNHYTLDGKKVEEKRGKQTFTFMAKVTNNGQIEVEEVRYPPNSDVKFTYKQTWTLLEGGNTLKVDTLLTIKYPATKVIWNGKEQSSSPGGGSRDEWQMTFRRKR